MDLPTYTNIWRIEKRLYKLYDFRLPMPLPINWIAVFVGITVPYIVFLIAIGLPFNHTLVWLYVLPPGLLTWLTTRPVIENKRLPELVESQVRYLTEPRVWTRLTPLNEKDQMVVTARVWHARQAPQRRKAATARAAAGTVALRGRNALARRGVAATVTGDPAEGNAPLAAASALAAAPATAANSRSRARARGTGPRVPAPGTSGRQRPPGKRTRPPRQDWAAQQREAARHDELPEETRSWPAEQPPRAQTTGTEDQAAKPSRFRLSGLRSRPVGQAPELPPGVALRPAEPRRPRFGSLPPSDQEGRARSWPGGPDRPGQAGPAWRMPAIRSAPPLGSVAAPMSSDLPAHATPDVYPASLHAPDVEPTTPAHAALPVHPALDIDLGGPVHVAPYAYLARHRYSLHPRPLRRRQPQTRTRPRRYTPPRTLSWTHPLGRSAQKLPRTRHRPPPPLTARRPRRHPLPQRSTCPIRPPSPQMLSLRPRHLLRPSCTRRLPLRRLTRTRPLSLLSASRPRGCTSSRRSTRLPRPLPPQTLSLRSRHLLRPSCTRRRPLQRLTRTRPLSLLSASRPRGCTSSRRSTRLLRLLPPQTSTRLCRRLRRPTSARRRRHPVWATCGQARRLLRRAARRALRYRMTGRLSGSCHPHLSRRSTPPWHGRRRGRSPPICPCFLLP